VASKFVPKDLKMKRGDTLSCERGKLSVVCWNGKWKVYVLANICATSAEGKFRDKFGNDVKSLLVEDDSTLVGYVDISDQMSICMSRRTGK
jgi:hypothetical protein